MAWSPYHVPLDASGTSGQDQSGRDLYHPYDSTAQLYPHSLATEQSTFSGDYLLYNALMQHSSEPIHPSYPIPYSSTHANFTFANHNMTHHPSSENNTPPSGSSTMGYASSGYSTACTTPSGSGRSSPSLEVPQSSVSRPEVQTICGSGRAHRPKHK